MSKYRVKTKVVVECIDKSSVIEVQGFHNNLLLSELTSRTDLNLDVDVARIVANAMLKVCDEIEDANKPEK